MEVAVVWTQQNISSQYPCSAKRFIAINTESLPDQKLISADVYYSSGYQVQLAGSKSGVTYVGEYYAGYTNIGNVTSTHYRVAMMF